MREARREERARKIAKKVYANLLDDRVRRVMLILFMSGPMTVWQIYKKWARQMLYGVDADVKQIAYTSLLSMFGFGRRRKNRLAYLVWIREDEVDKRKTKTVQLTELGMKIMKLWLFEGQWVDYQTLVDMLLEERLMERLPMPPSGWWQGRKRLRGSASTHNTTHSICREEVVISRSGSIKGVKEDIQINTSCSLNDKLQEGAYRTTEKATTGKGEGTSGERRNGSSGGQCYIVCDSGKVRKVDKTEVRALWRVLKETINEREITASEFGGCVMLYLKLKSRGWTIGEILRAIKVASKRVALRALEVMKFVYVHISELLHEWKVKLETYVQLKRAEREEEAKKERRKLLKKVREAKERVEVLRKKGEEGKELCERCGRGVVYKEHEGRKLCNECWTKEMKEKNLKILKKMMEREEGKAVRETAKAIKVGRLTEEDEEEIRVFTKALIEKTKERVRVCEICGSARFKEWEDGRVLCRLHFSMACLGKLEEREGVSAGVKGAC